jgi:hypothetical protein
MTHRVFCVVVVWAHNKELSSVGEVNMESLFSLSASFNISAGADANKHHKNVKKDKKNALIKSLISSIQKLNVGMHLQILQSREFVWNV